MRVSRLALALAPLLAVPLAVTPAATAGVPFSQQVRLVDDGPRGQISFSRYTGGVQFDGDPEFSRVRFSYDTNVYRLVEDVKAYNYYFVDIDLDRESHSGPSDVGFARIKTSTKRVTTQSEYTKTIRSTKNECDTLNAGITAGFGPLSAGTTVSKPIFCGDNARAKLDTSDQRRVGTYKLLAPGQAKAANFKKFIRVKAGAHPTFRVIISGPCDYVNPTNDVMRGSCTKSLRLAYPAND